MLLSELNLKALNINAQTILPVEQTIDVEGKVLKIKIVNFQSNYDKKKKTVVSGSASYGNTTYEFMNKDVTGFRASVAKALGIKNTAKVSRIHTLKEQTEVDKLRQNLAVARRLPKEWVKIDAAAVWKAYKEAKYTDRQERIKKIRQEEITPLLKQIEKAKLSDEARALLLASLQ